MEYVLEKASDPSARAKAIVKEKLNTNVLYEESGKPYVLGSYISISHSKDLVLVGFNQKPIGVDIETLRPFNKKLISRFFSEAEQDFIRSDLDFFRVWTAKEAYLKLTGEGLKNIKFNVVKDGKISIDGYEIKSFEAENCIISIVWEKNFPE